MSHRFNPTSLREYDIRGIVGETLAEGDAEAVGRSFGTVVRRAGGSKVAVGRDGRESSASFERALLKGLNASGVDVVRIGLGPTPMLYFAEAELGVDGGIMITGSHNPSSYNGFKMVLGHRAFFGQDIQALGRVALDGDWEEGSGGVRDEEVMDRYVDRLLLDFDGLPFRIGWDAGNGAGGPVVERLAKRLPGEHHLLYTEVDGRFPNHHPDPTVESNLEDLKALVAEKGLDFGIALDGDADRIGAVDGEGRVVWGDQLLAILAEPVLARHPGGTIIADVKASQALFDRVAELGGKPLMWKTGHSLIKSKMKETGAPLAGEMSGHIFFADGWYGFDDGIYAAIRLIRAVSALGGSLTDLRSAMPAMVNTPELRFQVDESRKFAVIDELLVRLARDPGSPDRGPGQAGSGAGAAFTVDRTDGARVSTPDGWWLLRASNTQDVLVARAEARDVEGLQRLIAQIDEQLALSGLTRGPQAGH
jgi:phosphomannomutase